MSNSSGVKTIVVPWRKIFATLPAVALIGAGISFAAPVPAPHTVNVAFSSASPAVVVPDTAMTMPALGAPAWMGRPLTGAWPAGPAVAPPVASVPALLPSVGTPSSSSAPVALDSTGVPVRALEAYQAAALVVGAADPACHVDWALLAAFGRVESNHARFGGNQLDKAGVAQPGIIGIPLDGRSGTALITDSDGGRLDRDSVYDRAVGPMQFIPSTWRTMGVDADRDGVKNPQDMADSAAATAVFVCSGPGDLSRPGDLLAAIMRYNPSDSYASLVTAIAAAYRLGVSALPAIDLPSTIPAAPVPAAPVRTAAVRTTAVRNTAVRTAAVRTTAVRTTAVRTTSVPTTTVPTTADPTTAVPSTAVPTTAVPTTTVPTTTVPTNAAPAPATPVGATRDPCLPISTPTDPNLPPVTATRSSTPVVAGICTITPPAPTPTPRKDKKGHG